ncbi:dihydrodipicolinate synthase/N-acetylneuraminate lyase [Humitalea rosea]|uniref:Dihydrodipicolinate synthase/N-acetylneuraminate lyase n=1 Tax=Humitalea rosea TaxID=990373 RepID=A0A2W7ILE8_9PROT|nr:dihydrodipicolinate synthase family protein [Humitalea rosea]PZW46521.1 dihydrodipicolinate synthase/N-acetylneuraminate lyase [Humitalea rosea]
MGLLWRDWPEVLRTRLFAGCAIPAQPLALRADRTMDPVRQRALSRYYLAAGAGGIAVGVHTTQFAIRDVGLFEPVLRAAAEVADGRDALLIAGAVGRTEQAVKEARIARGLGYHAVLLSLAAFRGAGEEEMIAHCEAVAAEMPLFGFYLQPAVGGVRLSASFWKRFAAIENVAAIKIAPFNRYATLDVVRGVTEAGALDRIALYTGNDDHIVGDLLTPFVLGGRPAHIVGGLLGHWSVWTERAVALQARCRQGPVDAALLALDPQVTEMNAAVFDVANDFAGCIAGCHEILRRQGLLEGIWCLDPDETLSPGQADLLTAVSARYPDLTDDAFVAANLNAWLV